MHQSRLIGGASLFEQGLQVCPHRADRNARQYRQPAPATSSRRVAPTPAPRSTYVPTPTPNHVQPSQPATRPLLLTDKDFNHCIGREVINGYLYMRNRCSPRLYVRYMAPGAGSASAFYLNAGQALPTGVRAGGGTIYVAACKTPFIPYSGNSSFWNGGPFACKTTNL